MKIQIDKLQTNEYVLMVDDAEVFRSLLLSDIVRKIEAYLKLRYLPEPTKISFMDRIRGVVTNGK